MRNRQPNPLNVEPLHGRQAEPIQDRSNDGGHLEQPPVWTSESGLAQIIKLQSTELERLARENERLSDQIDKLLELQEREQTLRHQLQGHLDHLEADKYLPNDSVDRDTIRQEARNDITGEVKPVLTAILELLERSLNRPAEDAGVSAAPHPDVAEPPSAHSLPAHTFEQFQALPDILTRPIEDLTARGRASKTGRGAPKPVETPVTEQASTPEPASPRQRPNTQSHSDYKRPGLPGVFAWTSVFS